MFGTKRRAAAAAEAETFWHDNLAAMVAVAAGELDVPTALALKAGERAVFTLAGAQLVEAHRGPGHWQGRSAGVSVPVVGRVRVRVGQSHGTFAPGAEAPTGVDRGTMVLTDRRAVFMGDLRSVEWQWAKLLGIVHHPDARWAAIEVSGRSKVQGFGYGTFPPDLIAAWCDLAVNLGQGGADVAAADLRAHWCDLAVNLGQGGADVAAADLRAHLAQLHTTP